jgi:hypothetical protein
VYENIARHQGQYEPEALAREVVDGWMNSPGHRQNILAPNATHLGVGLAHVGGTYYVTQCLAVVWSYLDGDLPSQTAAGGTLPIAGNAAEGSPSVSAVDVHATMDLDRQVGTARALVSGRRFSASLPLPSQPGRYRLSVNFQQGPSGVVLLGGPSFEVVRP